MFNTIQDAGIESIKSFKVYVFDKFKKKWEPIMMFSFYHLIISLLIILQEFHKNFNYMN